MNNNTIITYKAIYTLYNKEADLFINDYKIAEGCNLDGVIYQIQNRYKYYESIIKENLKEFINNKKYKYIKDRLEKQGFKTFVLSNIKIIQEIKIENTIFLDIKNLEV